MPWTIWDTRFFEGTEIHPKICKRCLVYYKLYVCTRRNIEFPKTCILGGESARGDVRPVAPHGLADAGASLCLLPLGYPPRDRVTSLVAIFCLTWTGRCRCALVSYTRATPPGDRRLPLATILYP